MRRRLEWLLHTTFPSRFASSSSNGSGGRKSDEEPAAEGNGSGTANNRRPKYRKKILAKVHQALEEKSNERPTIDDVDVEIQNTVEELGKACGESDCYPLLLEAPKTSITSTLVDDVFEELYGEFGKSHEKLLVVVSSGGGDMDAAYSLATLLRRFGSGRLSFVVPRSAKSAATLLVCSGDEILMSPVAELGPVDTQIKHVTRADGREEEFSALHIKTTLEIIGEQYQNGDPRLAKALLSRLQYPLTLGSFRKSLEIGRTYAQRLLASRMIPDTSKATNIAQKLVEGYESHNTCIDYGEALDLGLAVTELDGVALEKAWEIHRLERKKAQMIEEQEELALREKLQDWPTELLDLLGTSGATS